MRFHPVMSLDEVLELALEPAAVSRCRRCAPVPEEVRRAADLLERRWLLSIVYAAQEGAVRFNEFRYAVGEIPPRTLAARLGELEEAGLLERTRVRCATPARRVPPHRARPPAAKPDGRAEVVRGLARAARLRAAGKGCRPLAAA